MIDLLAARLPGRRIHEVGDAAYASAAWQGLPSNVTMTSRLRSNAGLYNPAPPPTGKQGRPRKWGARLPSLAKIALDPTTRWTPATVKRYGKTETLNLHEIDCLWRPLGPEAPAQITDVQHAWAAAGL